MRFQDIVGQDELINHLTEIIDDGRVSHAQHIVGDERDGSMQVAWAYLQYLCCEHRVHYHEGPLRADSCGECPSCRKIATLQHPDLHFVFPNPPNGSPTVSSADYMGEFRKFLLDTQAKGTLDDFNKMLSVDVKTSMIRSTDSAHIIDVLSMKPYEGGWRMLVIWNAFKMGTEAANELLKTLEEPMPKTIILLVDNYDKKILPTIASRVQTIRLREGQHDDAQQNAAEFAPMLVSWLRLLFKLKMKDLSAQVDKMSSMDREQQKTYLNYVSDVMRQCYLQSAAGLPCRIGSGDEKFDAMFPTMVTENNIELINNALNDALFAIERNAYSKLAFMELSFRMSKALKKR